MIDNFLETLQNDDEIGVSITAAEVLGRLNNPNEVVIEALEQSLQDAGAETIIETFTYVNNLVDGSDVTSIIYS